MSIELAPLFVPGDGNCFFNALSIVRKGDLTLSEQLRLLCSLELITHYILHAEYYQKIHDDLGLDVVSMTFVEACIYPFMVACSTGTSPFIGRFRYFVIQNVLNYT